MSEALTMASDSRVIYVDPSYSAFYEDKLFDLSSPVLNRDDQLLPLVRLRDAAQALGIRMVTADRLAQTTTGGGQYFSLGIVPDFAALHAKDVVPKAYVLMEPPVVAPGLYARLPELSQQCENIFLHNVHGDGYSLDGVRKEALKRFYWPIPYRGVLDEVWRRGDRTDRVVVINGSHRPLSKVEELYSERIRAIAALEKFGGADLYGRGWDRLIARCSLWWPALIHRRAILRAYRGPCDSKFETLSRHTFCLCFENMCMDGYISEKIFDCFYAGTVPIYLGPRDVTRYIPADAFVDARAYGSWKALFEAVRAMTPAEIARKREAAREFMEGDGALPFVHSFEDLMLGSRAVMS
ncbi:MAG: glycosyltransferase family 10 [Rhodocyclaceae bacterium]